MKRKVAFSFCILALLSGLCCPAAEWPLVTIREAGLRKEGEEGHDLSTMRRILGIHGAHRGSADEIWLAHCGVFTMEKTEADLRDLAVLRPDFERNGIALGFQQGFTLGHGSLAAAGILESETAHFHRFPDDAWAIGKNGERLEILCARSKAVQDYAEDYAATVCRTLRPVSLWLDDDMRMGLWKPDACFCDRCIAVFNDETGEKVTREELVRRLFTGAKPDPIRSKWFRFNSRSAALYAAAARRGVNRVDPECRLSLQLPSSDRYYRGFGFRTELAAASEDGRRPVGVRIGGGFYTEDAPRELVSSMLGVMLEIGRCRRECPAAVASFSYENENYTRQVINKSWEAILKQSALAFGAGCDATTIYTYDAVRPEPLEYVEEFAAGAAEWRPYFERLAGLSRRTVSAGAAVEIPPGYEDALPTALVRADLSSKSLSTEFRMGGKETGVRLALCGIPVVPAGAGEVATVSETEFAGWMKKGANGLTTSEIESIRDLLDSRSANRMPVRLKKTHALVSYPRVDGRGRLAGVTFFNASIGVARGMPVLLRNPSGSNFVWMSGAGTPRELQSVPGDLPGERLVIVPDIPGYGIATLFAGGDGAVRAER